MGAGRSAVKQCPCHNPRRERPGPQAPDRAAHRSPRRDRSAEPVLSLGLLVEQPRTFPGQRARCQAVVFVAGIHRRQPAPDRRLRETTARHVEGNSNGRDRWARLEAGDWRLRTAHTMTEQEIHLVPPRSMADGNPPRVRVRVGDTVRRTSYAWSPAVIDLLQHVEREGFDGAPRRAASTTKAVKCSPSSTARSRAGRSSSPPKAAGSTSGSRTLCGATRCWSISVPCSARITTLQRHSRGRAASGATELRSRPRRSATTRCSRRTPSSEMAFRWR